MVSFSFAIREDAQTITVEGGARLYRLLIMVMALVILLLSLLVMAFHGPGSFQAGFLSLVIFLAVLYFCATLAPYKIIFTKDKKNRRLIFRAIPGRLPPKGFDLLQVSALEVEDRGDWMARLHVAAPNRVSPHGRRDQFRYVIGQG
ncbi:MAG: hypothetical protein JG766_458 [Desulfacinum sp.]|jgi:hypothetical protein|nr:hypothetical protein [Desulfacinum sp.]